MKRFLRILKTLVQSFGIIKAVQATKTIQITEIENVLPDRSVSFKINEEETLQLKPNETKKGIGNYSRHVLPSLNEISTSSVSLFQVEGDQNPCSYAIVNKVGIISALGTDPSDYDIHDKAATYLSWDRIRNGQKVRLRVTLDDDQVVWVVGDLIDNL